MPGRAATPPPRSPRPSDDVGVVRRAVQVLLVAAQQLVIPWLLRRRTRNRAERLQVALERLGGTWIKLGQALALRFDLLPADYCLQLFQLLNQVRPFASTAVRQVLEQELKRPTEQLFRSFDWQPVAAASIGQVHRAELLDGTEVAVKVQRPGIRELVRADLRLMRWAATLIDALPFARVNARAVVREFARWTEEELDYRTEARHAMALRNNADGDPLERNPRVFLTHTTSRVLTLEYLSGVPVIDIITAMRRRDTAFLDRLAADGHDPQRIASHIVWNALNQIYRFGYFHADPHPANLVVLPSDAIGYMDFGIVGSLDEQVTASLRFFARSLFAGDIGNAVDEFMRFLVPSARTDVGAARRDLTQALIGYLDSERVGPDGATGSEAIFEIEMLAIARQHAMVLAPDAVRYLKAVLTAEAMVRELDPKFDLRGHENRFFRRLAQIELGETLEIHRAVQWVLDAPVQLNRLTEAIESLRETPAHLQAAADTVRRRVQASSLIGIIGLSAVLATLLHVPERLGWSAFGWSPRATVLGLGALVLIALAFSIVQVRRLPSSAKTHRIGRYPRRVH